MANKITYKNFNYLDQLLDTSIDLTEYLTTSLVNSTYTLQFNNLQPVVVTVKDIFHQITLVNDFKTRGTSFQAYNVAENEMPEDVSQRFYGSIDFWWVVCLYNNITNPLSQWPMSEEKIKYLATILSTKENIFSYQGYYNLLFDQNSQKRKLQILSSAQLPDLIWQFRNAILAKSSNSTISVSL